ncbi:MAG: senX3, partial [Phycisphaerales bacterium]|nr:senX3 [Phycisphaerales bacterium]
GRRVRSLTVRALARPVVPGADPVPVVVTYSGPADAFDRVLARLLVTLGAGGAVAGLAAAAVAYRVASTALRPLRDVARLVGSVDERKLDRRVSVAALPPELAPVGRRLNRMLGKLEVAFARRRRFLADASHELRTPVAALVTGLEVALARPRTADAYQARLADALADATGLRVLVERLMEQVRSEAFDHAEPAREVDLSALVADAVRTVAPLGGPRGIEVRADCPAGQRAVVEPDRLRSVLVNLLSNAVEYNVPGGTVSVAVRAAGGDLHLTVADTGVGIPEDQWSAVFEPFVRGDAARAGGSGHAGLGLFLVRTHLRAMGGRCALRSEVGRGSEFHVILPGAAASATAPAVPAAGSPTDEPRAGTGAAGQVHRGRDWADGSHDSLTNRP